MTNHWEDIKNANVVLVMGGNAAEAHPCGFKWVIEAKIRQQGQADRGRSALHAHGLGGRRLRADPRRAPTSPSSAASSATCSANDKIQHEYVKAYTNASFIVSEDFGFEDGLFSGYDAEKRDYDKSSWDYELDEKGFAKVDPTLQHPRCVLPAA